MISSKDLNQCLNENDFVTAVIYCDELLKKTPENTEIIVIKGWCLHRSGYSETAEKFILNAFEKTPESTQVATITMSYFMDLCSYSKVIQLCQRCIAFHADDSLMWHRLGISHYMLGENESSIMAFKRGLSISFSAASTFGISMPLLAQGRYDEAFPLYENRFLSDPKLNWLKCEDLPMPKWQGESIDGKSILLWSEQGLGDSIQFSRLVNILADRGATVDIILQFSHATLVNVLSTIKGVGQVMVMSHKSVTFNRRYDYHSSMMSLMGIINVSLDNIPAAVPYLFVPKNTLFSWQPYAKILALKVGLVWTTQLANALLNENAMHYKEKNKKNIPIAAIKKLLALPNCHFFVLQVDVQDDDKEVLANFNNISIMSNDITSFGDTAAIIDRMDLVISIDTSVVHLAGAMAKPTINILPYVSDWRWQKNREDSPWYPTMRLCKQAWKGNWSEAIDRVIPIVKKASKQWARAEAIDIF